MSTHPVLYPGASSRLSSEMDLIPGTLLTPLLPMPGPDHFLFADVGGGSSCSSSSFCGTKWGCFLGTFCAMVGQSVRVV